MLDAFRAIELVSADRHQVDMLFLPINLQVSGSLDSVGVERNAVLSADLPDLRQRIDEEGLRASSASGSQRHAAQCQVVALRTARGEYDLVGLAIKQLRHGFA